MTIVVGADGLLIGDAPRWSMYPFFRATAWKDAGRSITHPDYISFTGGSFSSERKAGDIVGEICQ